MLCGKLCENVARITWPLYVFFWNIITTGKLLAVTPLHVFALKIVWTTFSPNQKLIIWVGLLLSFGNIKSRGYHTFLEVNFVGFNLNLIALGIIYNFSNPLSGQFHYCFTQRGVLWDIHNGWQSENNNSQKRAKTESEAGHFMDYKENKSYYFIQLELLHLKNITKIFGEEQSKVLKITSLLLRLK